MTPSEFEYIARGLGKSQRSGNGFVAQCPAHDDQNPSLSLSLGDQGQFLAHCHAGCSFKNIIDALRDKGLLPYEDSSLYQKPVTTEVKQEANSNSPYARDLWTHSHQIQGTVGEVYLQSRLGDNLTDIPITLRFLPSLNHKYSRQDYPCIIAAVTHYPDKTVTALLRIYLAHDGSGKAPVSPNKMMLGNCKGGAIRLSAATEELIVCEGLEDGLSLMIALNKPVWVAGSASLLEHVIMPALPLASTVYLAQDNDVAGELGIKKLGNRLYAEGRDVNILKPPMAYKDFNQIFQEEMLNGYQNIQPNHQDERRNQDEF